MVDKPANDNTRHRYAEITRHTKLYQGAKKYGTFWPEEGSTEWWEEYLKKPGVKKFYKTNANTFEGLEYVAKHFGVLDHWNKFKDKKRPLWDLSWELTEVINEHGNENKYYHIRPIEGNQRYFTVIHTSSMSPHDIHNGTFEPGAMKVSHLARQLHNVPRKVLDNPPNLLDLNEKQRRESDGTGMHDTLITITGYYVTNKAVDAEELLRNCRVLSELFSRQKLESTTKDCMRQLEENLHLLDCRMYPPALYFRPDFRTLELMKQGKYTHKKPSDVENKYDPEVNTEEDEKRMFVQWPTVIDKPKYRTFLENILDNEARLDAMKLFEVPRVPDKSQIDCQPPESEPESWSESTMSPPFVPTLETQAYDALAGKTGTKSTNKASLRVTAKTANNYLMAPTILLIFYAASNNMTVEDAQEDKLFKRMLDYYLRYAVHGNTTTNSVELHGAYKHIYSCGSENNTYTQKAHIIGATLFLTELINSVITRELTGRQMTIEDRETLWDRTVKMLKATILIMGVKKDGQKNDHTIMLLGKSLLDVFFLHVHDILHSNSLHFTPQAIINYLSWQAAERIKDAASVHLKDYPNDNRLSNNRAPPPWVLMCCQMNFITEIARVISSVSLYPDLIEDPPFEDLQPIKKFYDSDGKQCVEEVESLKVGICNCLNANIAFKGVITRILTAERHPKSLIPPLILLKMCRLVEITREHEVSPFRSGLFYMGNTATPPVGETYRTVPVLGALTNGRPPADNLLQPISELTDVTLRNTIPIPTPEEPKKKKSCPLNLSILAQGNFKPFNPNQGEKIDEIEDNNAQVLKAWGEKFKLDVEKYKKKQPTPKPESSKKQKGGKKTQQKKDQEESPSTKTSNQTPETTPATTIRTGELESLEGLVASDGTPVTAARSIPPTERRMLELAAEVYLAGEAAQSNGTSDQPRQPKTRGGLAATARATSRVASTTPKNKVSEVVAQKALKKLNKGDVAQKVAVELAPSTQTSSDELTAVVETWKHVRTATHHLKQAITPSPSATNSNLRPQQRKQLENAATYMGHAERRCEALARDLGYTRNTPPGIHRGKGDVALSELLSTLQKPLATRAAIEIIGDNANLEAIEAEVTDVATSFGWSNKVERIKSEDLQQCAILFKLPSTKDLADTMSKIIDDLQKYADKPQNKSKSKKGKSKKVKETEAAAEYTRLLSRNLIECERKGWKINTVVDPAARYIILVWKSYYDHMNEQGTVTPSKRNTR